MKLKNSNCDKSQKLKLCGNSKNSNGDETQNSNCDVTKKKLFVMKLQISNCDETQIFKL